MTATDLEHRTNLLFAVGRMLDRCEGDAAGCVLWNGCLNSKGYGVVSFRGSRVLTHRLSYEFHVGPIADGMTIDHLCRNKRCVRPDHLEVVSREENSRRAAPHLDNCKRGHALTGLNLVMKKRGSLPAVRNCRACTAGRARAFVFIRDTLGREPTTDEIERAIAAAHAVIAQRASA
jgi:hypothetical protein